MAQKDTNPYPYSDSNKRYMTYDWYLKRRFGGKVAKVTLDAGCTCPNLDGFRGHGGCIYCKSGSCSAVGETIEEQYARGVEIACRKWKPVGFIPYFQSNTNTYGDMNRLRELFLRASVFEGAVAVDVATRADCLTQEAVGALVTLAEKIPVTVELGLQTTDDATAQRINRCHSYGEFVEGYSRLVRAAEDVNRRLSETDPVTGLMFGRLTVGVHLINGLPGESEENMLKTARDVAALSPDLVKIHLMHVLTDTALAGLYESGDYVPMERDAYVKITCDQLELLPRTTVIGRVTGDGIAEDLLAPQWSRRKTEVANEIDKELYRRNSWQGKYCE